MNGIDEDIYNNYFNIKPKKHKEKIEKQDNILYENSKSKEFDKQIVSGNTYDINILRQVADGNIDDIERLANILKTLCNASWGEDWGELSPDLKKGEDAANIILPQITIEINTRDISEDLGGLKPILFDIVKDDVTDDSFLLYRQWFDCDVEFNIYGRNTKDARQLMNKFEKLITTYTGYLKRNGVSEIFFLRETNPRCSLNYNELTPMRCIYYYVRLESIMAVRQSTIDKINAEIGVSKLNVDKVKTLIEDKSKNNGLIELDFFDGDNGITFDK